MIAAVSGGLDSVVLCQLLHEAKLPFAIAHCHFGLRSEESDKDAKFVEQLAKRLGVPFFLKQFQTTEFAEGNKLSIQLAARQLRYEWFKQLLEKETKYNWLATAHHADDHVETALMQFCRGTGISGLKGIPLKRGKIIRPLLFAHREEVLSFAQQSGLQWVEDSSNRETKYTRNHFRHEVLPRIEKKIKDVRTNIVDTIEHLKEAQILYQQAIEGHKKKLLEYKGREVCVPVLKLQKAEPLRTILFEIIRHYGFSSHQTGEVKKLLSSECGKAITSATHRILRNRKWLVISPLSVSAQTLILIDEGTTEIKMAEAALSIQTLPAAQAKIIADVSKAFLDARDITYPLILRRYKSGDYFYPLGMRKKKKLARFFIDQKLSAIDKEKAWVIESDKRIIWVVGMRIDDRFKVTPSTEAVIQFSWSNP